MRSDVLDGFELFEKGRKREAAATITARGIRISKALFEAMGCPDSVELAFNPNARQIALIRSASVNAYKMTPQSGGQHIVTASAFLDRWGLSYPHPRACMAHVFDGGDVVVLGPDEALETKEVQ